MNSLQELQKIPGVGKSIAQDFLNIGIKAIADLKAQNPEDLYLRMCTKQKSQLDRCLLYVCRCAVYFAETPNPDPEKLKWWNWKDKKSKKKL